MTEISFAWLLGTAFVVLKLCTVITWSWWWVTLPFWLAPAIMLLIAVFALIMAAICSLFDAKR
jgi:hypothetical protein